MESKLGVVVVRGLGFECTLRVFVVGGFGLESNLRVFAVEGLGLESSLRLLVWGFGSQNNLRALSVSELEGSSSKPFPRSCSREVYFPLCRSLTGFLAFPPAIGDAKMGEDGISR